MSNAVATTAKPQEKAIMFIPLGEKEAISLTISQVKRFLCVPTRSGQLPSDEQVVKFMMLCKAQSLNPWVNDAYLVGYDSKDGPSFSLITSHQAMLKRAEASEDFNGIESGVVVQSNGQTTERPGKIVFEGEKLVGGWSRVHRKDRSVPTYDSVALATYNTNRSRWAADPAGMIVKVAEAAALRKTYPSNLADLYCKEEMQKDEHQQADPSGSLDGNLPEKPATRVEAAKQMASRSRPAAVEQAVEQVADQYSVENEPQGPSQDVVGEEEIKRLLDAVQALIPDDKEERLRLYQSAGCDPLKKKWPVDGVAKVWAWVEEQHESRKQ